MFAMGPAFFKSAAGGYTALTLSGTFSAATVGTAYSSSIPISGGLEPYSLTGGTGVASGSLDSGFALSITGTVGDRFLTLACASPATADTMSFTASVGSSDGQTAVSAQSVAVAASAIDAWFAGGGSGLWLDARNGAWRDAAGTTAAVVGDPVRLWQRKGGSRNVAASSDATSAALRYDAILGRNYLEFTAASLQQYIVNSGVKGDWKALSDGSEFVIVAKVSFGKTANPLALFPLVSTASVSSTQIGINVFYDDRSSFSDSFRVFLSAGGGVAMDVAPLNAITPQTVVTLSVSNLNTPGPTFDLLAFVNGTLQRSAQASAYAVGDPQDMLTIGGSHGSFYADMKLYALAIIIGPGVTANRAAYEAAI